MEPGVVDARPNVLHVLVCPYPYEIEVVDVQQQAGAHEDVHEHRVEYGARTRLDCEENHRVRRVHPVAVVPVEQRSLRCGALGLHRKREMVEVRGRRVLVDVHAESFRLERHAEYEHRDAVPERHPPRLRRRVRVADERDEHDPNHRQDTEKVGVCEQRATDARVSEPL